MTDVDYNNPRWVWSDEHRVGYLDFAPDYVDRRRAKVLQFQENPKAILVADRAIDDTLVGIEVLL